MKIRATVAVLFILLALGALWGMVRDRTLSGSFATIPAKASEAQVRAAMGPPSAIERPCRAYDTEITAPCDHVFVYRSAFAPLRHMYWLVFFDENNRATATSSQREP